MAATNISTLIELRRFPRGEAPPWHAYILQPELNGGRTTESALSVLEGRPEVTTLTVSGLDQRTFEWLINRHGGHLTDIHLWKCPRIEDFTPLESIPRLSRVAMFWNQRATRFWNLSKTPSLRGLHFDDFIKLERLDDIAAGTLLQELDFGNANWSKAVVNSLEPLRNLNSLSSLAFNVKAIRDGRVQPLADLRNLREFAVSSRLFTTEQFAWLRAKLPDTLQSPSLEPIRPVRQPIRRGTKVLDVLVNGKGKPFLSTELDGKKLTRYSEEFERLVAKFRNDPDLEPGNSEA